MENLSVTELQQYRANAYKTACNVYGNRKMERNDDLVAQYIEELAHRGIAVDYSIQGVKNGIGSY